MIIYQDVPITLVGRQTRNNYEYDVSHDWAQSILPLSSLGKPAELSVPIQGNKKFSVTFHQNFVEKIR